jgi:hypothetical protein
LKEKDIQLIFVEVNDSVVPELAQYGLTTAVGADKFYAHINDVLAAYRPKDGTN